MIQSVKSKIGGTMNTPKQTQSRQRAAKIMRQQKAKVKTSPKQLAMVRDWERRNPEQAQARKNAWAVSQKGKEWLAKNQKKKNKARDAWRKKKRREAKRALRRSKS